MANGMLIGLGMITAIAPLGAVSAHPPARVTPPAGPDARYCLRVDPVTGSNVGTIQCWTRDQWTDQDVDLDKEWARWGVGVPG